MRRIDISWTEPIRLSELDSDASRCLRGRSGVYLWLWQPRTAYPPLVSYVGETSNFAERMQREIADTVGFGGTYLRLLDQDDDPMHAIRREPAENGVYLSSCRRIGFRWDPRSGVPLMDHLSKHADKAMAYISEVKVVCGALSDDSLRGEVEGGLIDHFVKVQGIKRWPGSTKRTEYIIGCRTHSCREEYALRHVFADDCEADCLRDLLPDRLYPSL